VLFQIFPAVSQSTLETRFITTITIHQNLASRSSRYSDKIVTTAQNGVCGQQSHTFEKTWRRKRIEIIFFQKIVTLPWNNHSGAWGLDVIEMQWAGDYNWKYFCNAFLQQAFASSQSPILVFGCFPCLVVFLEALEKCLRMQYFFSPFFCRFVLLLY